MCMNMNKRQLVTLWSGIAVLVLILIIPPWKFTFYAPKQIYIEIPGSYAFILTPPEVPVTEMSRIDTSSYFHGLDRDKWSVKIDLQRMLLPVIPVVVLISIYFVIKSYKSGRNRGAPLKFD